MILKSKHRINVGNSIASNSVSGTTAVGVVAVFTITTTTVTAYSGVPVVFNINSSISVTGLTDADITVTGGVAELLQGSGSSYTIRVTPSAGSGTVSITIIENAVSETNVETSLLY